MNLSKVCEERKVNQNYHNDVIINNQVRENLLRLIIMFYGFDGRSLCRLVGVNTGMIPVYGQRYDTLRGHMHDLWPGQVGVDMRGIDYNVTIFSGAYEMFWNFREYGGK
jgi:hypothetical protein